MFGGRIVTAPDKYCYTSRRVKQPQSGAASTNSGCLMVLILLSTLLQFDCRLPPDKTPMLRPNNNKLGLPGVNQKPSTSQCKQS